MLAKLGGAKSILVLSLLAMSASLIGAEMAAEINITTMGTYSGPATVNSVLPYLTSSIIGYVVDDRNGNGVWDSGEPGMAGVELMLIGYFVDGFDGTNRSNSSGKFKFTHLLSQYYEIGVITSSLPKGYQSTTGQDVQKVWLTPSGARVYFFYSKSCYELAFVAGTNTETGQGWEKAVDDDTVDVDGTVMARGADPDPAGPAWGVFQFGCGQKGIFNSVCIKTDNGIAETEAVSRQASLIEIWVSIDGVKFDSVTTIEHNTKLWKEYPLLKTVTANFIKLVLKAPLNTVGHWRQLVEFKTKWNVSTTGFTPRNDNNNYLPWHPYIPPAWDTISAATSHATDAPTSFALRQNYPNPFNPKTTISFDLAKSGPVTVVVYDLTGRLVAKLVDGALAAGTHHVVFNAQDLPSGHYFYRLITNEFNSVKTMMLVK